jgi:hypothetical protein
MPFARNHPPSAVKKQSSPSQRSRDDASTQFWRPESGQSHFLPMEGKKSSDTAPARGPCESELMRSFWSHWIHLPSATGTQGQRHGSILALANVQERVHQMTTGRAKGLEIVIAKIRGGDERGFQPCFFLLQTRGMDCKVIFWGAGNLDRRK